MKKEMKMMALEDDELNEVSGGVNGIIDPKLAKVKQKPVMPAETIASVTASLSKAARGLFRNSAVAGVVSNDDDDDAGNILNDKHTI